MDLRSGLSFWPLRDGLGGVYPPLAADTTSDVVVIGSGITGALIAWRLVEAGISTILLDRRDCAMGSTAASTAVIQYEIDTSLVDLSKQLGEDEAVQSYQACRRSIGILAELDAMVQKSGHFQNRRSIYLCSTPADEEELRKEYELRRKHDFRCEWWSREQLRSKSDLDFPAAIVTEEAGELDPYAFTHALLAHSCQHGLRIFDRTEVTSWKEADDGVELETNRGITLHPQHVVFGGGFETTTFLDERVAKLISTYAFVSEPITHWDGWPEESVIWETARPYLYARRTDDHRLLIGGEDISFKNDRVRDYYLDSKIEKLAVRGRELFPRLNLEVAFSWAGTFGETEDGLPYISAHPESDRMLLAMCYGGNGITYSVLAAEICRDAILGKHHPLAELFSLARRERTHVKGWFR